MSPKDTVTKKVTIWTKVTCLKSLQSQKAHGNELGNDFKYMVTISRLGNKLGNEFGNDLDTTIRD